MKGEYIEAESLFIMLDSIEIKPNDIIEISGGEPTTHPDIIQVLSYIKQRYATRLILVSNAEVCSLTNTASKIAAGIDEIITNIYSVDESIHDTITQTHCSLKRKLQGLENLSRLGKDISLKIVPMLPTYKDMSRVIKEFERRIEKGHRLILRVLDLSGDAKDNQKQLAVRLSNVSPYLEETIEIARRIFSKIELYFPLCLLKQKNRIYYASKNERVILISPNRGIKTILNKPQPKPQNCAGCIAKNECHWFRESYIEVFGDKEFNRIIKEKSV